MTNQIRCLTDKAIDAIDLKEVGCMYSTSFVLYQLCLSLA